MTWQGVYQEASFRNVPFYVRTNNTAGGRRLITHEYPRSERYDNEDLGIAVKSFSVDGYLIGDTVWKQWQKLEKALEEGTTGILVHPYRGTKRVDIGRYKVLDVHDKGRLISFTFETVVSSDQLKTTPDRKKLVTISKEQIDDAATEWLTENYSLVKRPYNAIDDARAALDRSFSFIEKGKQSAARAAAFKRSIDDTKGRIIALSLNAEAIANTYIDVINYGLNDILDFGLTKKDQMREIRDLFDYSVEQPVNTVSTLYSADDYPAYQIQSMMSYACVGAMVSLIPLIDYQSITDAENEQKELFDRIDRLSRTSIVSDSVFAALRDSRTAVHNFLKEQNLNLPYLITFKPEQPNNTLALSYKYYGTIVDNEKLAAINNLIHPGFVSSGVDFTIWSER